MAIDSNLLNELSEISAEDAIELLCTEFGLGRSWITFVNTHNRAEVKSFLGAIYLRGIAAADVGPIEFWGGPPTRKGYQKGTLLTYLCDAILLHWAIEGNYADMVQGTHEDQLYVT
ncbi:MAG: hypothetical protein WC315_00370 [Candidatus Omnitrophota bacterium]|jgi:hypothetical protein